MKLRVNDLDITNYVNSVTWSGTDTQASRSVSFTVANSPYDPNFSKLNIKLGALVYLYEESKCIYIGVITTRERDGEIGTIPYESKDFMHYLLRSNGTYSFKKKTPQAIAKIICNDLQINTGHLVNPGVKLKKLLVDNESYYNIILKAYQKAAKTTKGIYMPIMDGFKLSVIAKGEYCGITLYSNSDLTKSGYKETLDSMTNQIKIYKDNGKKGGTVKKSRWVKKYGVYQQTYTKEDGVNAKKAAKKLLTGIDKTAQIEAIGNVACKSGYSLKIYDKATKLTGTFYITSDSHTWSDGIHTMSLELAFKNIMEETT